MFHCHVSLPKVDLATRCSKTGGRVGGISPGKRGNCWRLRRLKHCCCQYNGHGSYASSFRSHLPSPSLRIPLNSSFPAIRLKILSIWDGKLKYRTMKKLWVGPILWHGTNKGGKNIRWKNIRWKPPADKACFGLLGVTFSVDTSGLQFFPANVCPNARSVKKHMNRRNEGEDVTVEVGQNAKPLHFASLNRLYNLYNVAWRVLAVCIVEGSVFHVLKKSGRSSSR